MDDLKVKAKKSVLEEIMKLMGDSETESLKSKSPKFAKVEVEAIAKPESNEAGEDDEAIPKSGMDIPKMSMDSDEMSDDDKLRLQELYEKYC